MLSATLTSSCHASLRRSALLPAARRGLAAYSRPTAVPAAASQQSQQRPNQSPVDATSSPASALGLLLSTAESAASSSVRNGPSGVRGADPSMSSDSGDHTRAARRAEIMAKTELGRAPWRADGSRAASGGSPLAESVPDKTHRGIGAIDEGVDGLREAGFLNDGEARTLASSSSTNGNATGAAGLAHPRDSPDGACNVYAIDDEYKEIAFTIMDLTERDFAGKTATSADHDKAYVADSFTDLSAELAAHPPGVELATAVMKQSQIDPAPEHQQRDHQHDVDMAALSPAVRLHAAALYATHVAYSWRPEPIALDEHALPPHHHRHHHHAIPDNEGSIGLRALGRDPSALVPGARRPFHSLSSRRVSNPSLASAAAMAMLAAPRTAISQNRAYTYIAGLSEYLEELESGRTPAHYDTLRAVLAKSPPGSLYRQDAPAVEVAAVEAAAESV
ncbi:hypothetical protein H9P43_003129 [Blastocladiella emersonii ATCC 22665]|nr:hypothetical protein H9P43_003129 [Blastocladiella emersonii ATCC 22665]